MSAVLTFPVADERWAVNFPVLICLQPSQHSRALISPKTADAKLTVDVLDARDTTVLAHARKTGHCGELTAVTVRPRVSMRVFLPSRGAELSPRQLSQATGIGQ